MKLKAAGLMSGTSLDGIDVVIAEIDEQDKTNPTIIASETYPYSEILYRTLKKLLTVKKVDLETLTYLNKQLAIAYADAIKDLCSRHNIQTEALDYVASHGQTIYHISKQNDPVKASTLQLGDASIMAQMLKTTVINNFRSSDIAVEGEGAPLVPFADYQLFKDTHKNRVLQNIGGIGNVTVIPANSAIDEVFAFDTGPGNMMIDYAMQKYFNKPYDKEGKHAAKGVIIESLLKELTNHPYLNQPIPKSTGRELFGDDFTEHLLKNYQSHNPYDIIATLTHFTAISITQSYQTFIADKYPIDEVIVSGGGAHNKTLMKLIKQYYPNTLVETLEALGFNSDYKEALAFIMLGYETIHKRPSNVKGATGAKASVILGQIAYYQ